MNIEFHYPAGTIPEGLVEKIERQIAVFHQEHPEISRVEVHFMNQPTVLNSEYGCRIDLTIFGNSLMVRRFGGSFAIAADEVLNDVNERLKERKESQKDLPDPLYSSVEV